MKKVLIIAYYFPPSGGPGVQRVLKHVKFLREFGWEPVVLTVSNGQFPARDESLLAEIPKDVKVFRTKIFEPYDIYRFFTGKKKGSAIDVNTIKKDGEKSKFTERIAEFIRATFFIPDARIGWYWSAKKEALKIIKEEKIAAIYSSSPPYTCSLIAKKLKNITNLPWVAGFRDPWTGFISTPKRWFLPKSIDKKMEFSVFNQADFVECAWLGIIKDAIGKYPNLDKSKFIHVPNGYDSSEFPDVKFEENEKFTITYTGSMYGRRNPKKLFEAIEELVQETKIVASKLILRFIGRFGDEIHQMFNSVSFVTSIETHGYMEHKRSIEYLLKSDASLLIVDESKESEEIVPGKVYEYLGVGKPILTIAPNESAISKLINETEGGLVAHQSEIEKIKENFYKFYKAWETKIPVVNPKTNKIKQYERRENAKTLASLFENIS